MSIAEEATRRTRAEAADCRERAAPTPRGLPVWALRGAEAASLRARGMRRGAAGAGRRGIGAARQGVAAAAARAPDALAIARRRAQALAILAILLSLALTQPRADRYGDTLQVALPLAALGCAVLGGGAGELLARFAGTWVVLHGTKNALGELPINLRPSGGHRGLPSGHTTAAAFGASALAHSCLQAPIPRMGAVVAASFVGVTRADARAHNSGQVLVGGLLGIAGERAARRPETRRRLRAMLERLGRGLARAARTLAAQAGRLERAGLGAVRRRGPARRGSIPSHRAARDARRGPR